MSESKAATKDLDPQDMLGIVRSSPTQWRDALKRSSSVGVVEVASPRAVFVAGMGGSGIAGDVAALAASIGGTCPVVPWKGYEPPSWLGEETPVIAVSHSGNTEETLAFVAVARKRGAPVHVVTSGGKLARLAEDAGWSAAVVPGDMQPRASLPSLVTPVLLALSGWKVIPEVADDLAGLPDHLTPIVAEDKAGDGQGVHLAAALHGRTGLFLGGRGIGALVAMRGACQVAENAEDKAFHAELPEFDHNALVGFSTPADDGFVVVTVRDPEEHDRVAARFAPTLAALSLGVSGVETLRLPQGPWLHRLAAGILEVDLASVHLALANHRDPTPVDVLVQLKSTLAGL